MHTQHIKRVREYGRRGSLTKLTTPVYFQVMFAFYMCDTESTAQHQPLVVYMQTKEQFHYQFRGGDNDETNPIFVDWHFCSANIAGPRFVIVYLQCRMRERERERKSESSVIGRCEM